MTGGKVFISFWDTELKRLRRVELIEIEDLFKQRVAIRPLDMPGVIKEVLVLDGMPLTKLETYEDTRFRSLDLTKDSARAWTKVSSIFKRVRGSVHYNTHGATHKADRDEENPKEPLHPIVAKILKENWGSNAFLIFSGDEIDIGLKEAYHSKRGIKSPDVKEENDEPTQS